MIELGLQRISRLLADVSLPWRAIHVAGTNGKGSVCTYISGMLDTYNRSAYREQRGHAEIRHGRYMSPHLIDRWDCISLRQQTIKKADFDHIEGAVLARNTDQKIGASEFELMTATAFEAFARCNLDVGVIEVGMGGRLDATNVVGTPMGVTSSKAARPPPLVTAISRIGMDHQGFLGDTIEAIAAEKAGIIKSGVPVVYDSDNQPEVCNVIEATAHRNHSPLVTIADLRVDRCPLPYNMLPGREVLDTDFPTWMSSNYRSQYMSSQDGAHLKSNTSVAIRAAWTALQSLGRIPRSAKDERGELQQLLSDMILSPLRITSVPGRLEYVDIRSLTGTHRTALLDGAHNSQSAEVLAREVEQLRLGEPVTWVLAASDTKDVKEILRPLIQAQDQVVAVEFGPVDGMPWVRPMKASAILNAVYELVPTIKRDACYDCGNDVLGAIRTASRKSYFIRKKRMVIAGSLYLVGHIHRLLRDASQTKT